MKTNVCIIGAGPAGLFGSIFLAQSGIQTIVIERNSTACRKLLHTGRTRCNITHTGSVDDFVKAYKPFGRFLKHSLHEFSPDDLRQYFADHNLQTKIENNGCVFPITDRASDVSRVLVDQARKLTVKFLYGAEVKSIKKEHGSFTITTNKTDISASAVIIATGGVTWPFTGSTGDGYRFAKQLGHKIIEPRASLAPLVTQETWPSQLAGVGIKSVSIKTTLDKKRIGTQGPLMFTSNGIGGPAVYDLSRLITDHLPNHDNPIKIKIDLMPEHNTDQLEEYIISLCHQHPKKELPGALARFLPRTLMLNLCSQLSPAKMILAGELQKTQRKQLLTLLKQLPLSIVSTTPIAEATVTRGGVSTDQIDPKTMQSKLCPNLYFAGEVINADGPCGGYNLQIAFSTGHLAAISAAQK